MRRILAKILFCDEAMLGLVLMHMPVGVINALMFLLFPSVTGLGLGLAFGWGFVQYQVNERNEIHDTAYPDIQGWLYGMSVTAITAWFVRSLR